MGEDPGWLRLDTWLWQARFAKTRPLAARLVTDGAVRINRQPTEKPHGRLRPGDVITLAVQDRVLVLRILRLGARRGPATEARALYEELGPQSTPCTPAETTAYRLHEPDFELTGRPR